MSCIEPDRDSWEMEVCDKVTAAAHKARDAAVLTTEVAVLTYLPQAVWINPVQAREIEHSLRQAMASMRHVMRFCKLEHAA